jgi:predicted ArsR family transcriptional regulator
MNTLDKEKARSQTQMLLELRRQYSEQVKRAQELLKEQQAVRKALRRILLEGPRSVPQLADASGLPAPEVLWHIAAMKKYGLVEEAGMDEQREYYLYSLTKEARS